MKLLRWIVRVPVLLAMAFLYIMLVLWMSFAGTVAWAIYWSFDNDERHQLTNGIWDILKKQPLNG